MEHSLRRHYLYQSLREKAEDHGVCLLSRSPMASFSASDHGGLCKSAWSRDWATERVEMYVAYIYVHWQQSKPCHRVRMSRPSHVSASTESCRE